MTTYHWIEICDKINDNGHIINIKIKYTTIIVVQYTIAKDGPFIVQFYENASKININHSPLQYLLYNNQ